MVMYPDEQPWGRTEGGAETPLTRSKHLCGLSEFTAQFYDHTCAALDKTHQESSSRKEIAQLYDWRFLEGSSQVWENSSPNLFSCNLLMSS